MPGKHTWYNFNTGGATPTPVVTQHSQTGLAPGQTGTYRIDPSFRSGTTGGSQIDLGSGRNIIRRRVATDGSGNEYALDDPGLDPNKRYGSAQYIPTKSRYDSYGQLYGDVDQGVQGYEQAQTNLGNIQGLQDWQANYQPQDLSGYAQLSDLPQQQDISGIGSNQQAIGDLQQQLAVLQAGPTPGVPGTQGALSTGSAAQQPWETYLAGTNPYQIGGGYGAGGTPTDSRAFTAPLAPQVTTVPATGGGGGGGSSDGANVHQTPTGPLSPAYDPYGSSVSPEYQKVRDAHVNPGDFDPFDINDKAAGTTYGEYSNVLNVDKEAAANKAGIDYDPGFTAGADQATQHAGVEKAYEDFGDALKAQQEGKISSAEVAALNPAFNKEVAEAQAGNEITITDPITGEVGTIQAKDLNSVDAAIASGGTYTPTVDEFGYIDATKGGFSGGGTDVVAADAKQKVIDAGGSDDDGNAAADAARDAALAKQYEILGKSVTASGVKNIGGDYNQGGDNYGLPNDYLVSRGSDGSTEVFGPGGKTYDSVEAAQVAANSSQGLTGKVGELASKGLSGAVKSQLGPLGGLVPKDTFSGGGADGKGSLGKVGDFFGGIGDKLGLTDFSGEKAAAEAAEAKAKPAEEKAKSNTPSFFNPVKGSGTLSEAEVAQRKVDTSKGGVNYTSSSDQRRDNEAAAAATRARAKSLADASEAAGVKIRHVKEGKTVGHQEAKEGLANGSKTIARINGGTYLVTGSGVAEPVNPNTLRELGYDPDTIGKNNQPRDPGPPPQAIAQQAAPPAPAPTPAPAPRPAPAPAPAPRPAPAPSRTQQILDAGNAIQTQRAEAAKAAGPAAQAAHLANVRAQLADPSAFWANLLAQGNNNGGPIMGYNTGGMVSPEEAKELARRRIAASQVRNAPLAQAAKGGQAAPPRSYSGESAAAQVAKKALLSQLGPLGGLLGGLFNEGGMVEGYNKGGSVWDKIWGSKSGKKGSFWEQTGRNDGGPIPMAGPLGNPMGYNEGGPAAGPTPIKRVQDEQKIELDKMTWEKMEARKDQQMQMDEKRKQEAFQMEQMRKAEAHKEAMKMKKAAATTNKGPLGG